MSVPESTLPQFPLPESPLPESTSKKHKGADDSTDAFLDDHLSAFKRNLLKYAAAVGHEELRQAVLSDLNDAPTDASQPDHLSALKWNLLKYAAYSDHVELREAVLSDLNPEEPVEVEIDPQWEEDPAMNGPRK